MQARHSTVSILSCGSIVIVSISVSKWSMPVMLWQHAAIRIAWDLSQMLPFSFVVPKITIDQQSGNNWFRRLIWRLGFSGTCSITRFIFLVSYLGVCVLNESTLSSIINGFLDCRLGMIVSPNCCFASLVRDVNCCLSVDFVNDRDRWFFQQFSQRTFMITGKVAVNHKHENAVFYYLSFLYLQLCSFKRAIDFLVIFRRNKSSGKSYRLYCCYKMPQK